MFGKKPITRKKERKTYRLNNNFKLSGYKITILGKHNEDGPGGAIIIGALGIIEYTSEVITLDIGSRYISISGKELKCVTYTGGAVEIKGNINYFQFKKVNGI